MRNFIILTSSAVALSISGCNHEGELSAHIEVGFEGASSPDLLGLTNSGEHHQFQQVTVTGWTQGGEVDVVLTLLDPDNEAIDQATVSFPDESFQFTPDRVGTWKISGEALDVGEHSIGSELDEKLSVEVVAPPQCDQLQLPVVQDLELVQPDEVYPSDGLRLACVGEEWEDIGEVPAFTLTVVEGAYLDGDPSKLSCNYPEEPCELTIIKADQLLLQADGELLEVDPISDELTGDSYPVEQQGWLQQVLGYPPVLECGFDEDAPRVSVQDFGAWAIARVVDESDVGVSVFVRGIDAQDIGVYELGSTDEEVLGSGETHSIDLADVPVVVGPGGTIEVTITAVTVDYGIEDSCRIELDVAPMDPYGHGALAQAWDSSIWPAGTLSFDGPFELRYLLERYEDYAYAGDLFTAAQGYTGMELSIDGDQITLSIRAETTSGDWEDETLEATLDRLDGEDYPTEIRVASSLDSLALIIDGQVRDQATTAFDFSALSRGEVEIAKVPMLTLDAFAFFQGQPAGGPPLESPCTSMLPAQTDDAFCIDFNEQGLGTYGAGDAFDGAAGSYLFQGDYELIGL
jgi:hypothetical protein